MILFDSMNWNLNGPKLNGLFKSYWKCDLIGNFLSFRLLYSATIPSGALQGALNAVVEFAKQNRTDAAQMGKKIAESAGIQPEYGLAFASGFYDTARFGKWAEDFRRMRRRLQKFVCKFYQRIK